MLGAARSPARGRRARGDGASRRETPARAPRGADGTVERTFVGYPLVDCAQLGHAKRRGRGHEGGPRGDHVEGGVAVRRRLGHGDDPVEVGTRGTVRESIEVQIPSGYMHLGRAWSGRVALGRNGRWVEMQLLRTVLGSCPTELMSTSKVRISKVSEPRQVGQLDTRALLSAARWTYVAGALVSCRLHPYVGSRDSGHDRYCVNQTELHSNDGTKPPQTASQAVEHGTKLCGGRDSG